MTRPYLRRKSETPVCGVYGIFAPSGGIYVGSSADIEERWSQHRRDLRRGTHVCQPLQRAWNKYGEHLEWRILAQCEKTRLIDEEQAYIDTRDPKKLYNVNLKADRVEHTPEVRAKLSVSGKIVSPARLAARKKLADFGREHGHEYGFQKGVKFPREHFDRLREANKKLAADFERLAARGRAISAAKKGKVPRPGYALTSADREKAKIRLRQVLTGKSQSAETRLKRSVAMRRAWAEGRHARCRQSC